VWQPAVVRFGAIAIAALACRSGKPPATIGNSARGDGDLTAAYYCSIHDGGFTYPTFPCAVRKIEGRWMLAKLAGSQRFRGQLTPQHDGFAFAGELYCPWGDCTQPLHGVFTSLGDGRLRGTFRDARMIVLLAPAPDAAFGGASYGGDGYGGFGYGDSYRMPLQRNPGQ
jgi:hypothetical protein